MPGDLRAITDSDPGVDVASDVPDGKAEQGRLTDASPKRAGVGKSLCIELDGTLIHTNSLIEGASSLVSGREGTGKLLRSLMPNHATCKQQVRILAELEVELRDWRVPLDQPSLLRCQTGNG
jgi:hypothetical protein